MATVSDASEADCLPEHVTVRVATIEDHVAVSRVLDGALLDVDGLQQRLADGSVLVATLDDGTMDRTSPSVVGAVVVATEGADDRSAPTDWPACPHVRSIAVRRKHRRRGIGTALLRAATDRWSPLVADFDADARSFYVAFGAECAQAADGRHWALLADRD